MLGLAEVVLALAELGQRPAEGVLADLAELPQQVVAAKLLRGKGGDIMRAAYCRCIPAWSCIMWDHQVCFPAVRNPPSVMLDVGTVACLHRDKAVCICAL